MTPGYTTHTAYRAHTHHTPSHAHLPPRATRMPVGSYCATPGRPLPFVGSHFTGLRLVAHAYTTFRTYRTLPSPHTRFYHTRYVYICYFTRLPLLVGSHFAVYRCYRLRATRRRLLLVGSHTLVGSPHLYTYSSHLLRSDSARTHTHRTAAFTRTFFYLHPMPLVYFTHTHGFRFLPFVPFTTLLVICLPYTLLPC